MDFLLHTLFIRLLAHNDEMVPSTSQEGISQTASEVNSSCSSTVPKSYKCEE